MHNPHTTGDITFGSLLYTLFRKPLFSAILFTMISIILVFFNALYGDSNHGLMLPLYIHLIVAVIAYAPGVGLRFALYRRWWDRQDFGSSGSMSFFVVAVESIIFLAMLSNGIDAASSPAVPFIMMMVYAVGGTIANIIFLIIYLLMRRYDTPDYENMRYITADVVDERVGEHDFFNEGHYPPQRFR